MANVDLSALQGVHPTTADGKPLPPHKTYEKACQEDARPNSFEEPTWAEPTLEPLLKPAGDAAPLIFDSVLALWRLKLCERDLSDEHSSDDDPWRENVVGRLRYHIWLCRQVNIEPLKVVIDYMEALRVTGLLPQAMIPPLAEEPEPEPQQISQLKPSRPTLTDTEISQCEQPSDIDDEMPLASVQSQANVRPRRQTRTPARFQDTTAKGSTAATRENTGAKRDPSASPPKTQTGKRTKIGPPVGGTRLDATVVGLAKDKQRDKVAEPIDLSGMSFLELSVVDPKLVPELAGQICNACQGSGQPGCVALWRLNAADVTFGCSTCAIKKFRCSFGEQKWNISKLPTVTATRPRQDVATRKNNRAATTSIFRENSTDVASPSTQTPRISNTTIDIMDPSTMESTFSATGDSNVRWLPCLVGRTEQLILEDIVGYESALDDPRRSSFTIGHAITRVRGAKHREEGTLKMMKVMVESRSSEMDRLLHRLEKEKEKLIASENNEAEVNVSEMDVDEGGDEN